MQVKNIMMGFGGSATKEATKEAMLAITHELAQRLECAEALDASACAEAACKVETACDTAVKSVAGGMLTFCGPVSPLTHAIGLALHGPITEEEVEEVEEFFHSREAPVAIDVTPFSDPSLRDILCERGYHITEFNQVLGRSPKDQLLAPECVCEARVRKARPDEKDAYVRAAIVGFFGRPQLTDDERILGEIIFQMGYATPYLAEIDGEIGGSAGMSIRNGIASCFGDSTLPSYRRKGIQMALICSRISDAIAAGAELMTASTQPGSSSQTNYEKAGFQVAYSKITMVLH